MHGVKAFSLPIEELSEGATDQRELKHLKEMLTTDWIWFGEKVEAVVAVSVYAAEEVMRAFDLPAAKIQVIYNGLDSNIFKPQGKVKACCQPYFLNVSSVNPIKNLGRLFSAYTQLPKHMRPGLVTVAPGFSGEAPAEDVQVVREEITQEELSSWYRGAIGLVLPSLRETFGMPILEAMACGCPVITSNTTGCSEIAAEAALLVNPRSVNDIERAMKRLANDMYLRQTLRQKGLERANSFDWRICAEKLLSVFTNMLSQH